MAARHQGAAAARKRQKHPLRLFPLRGTVSRAWVKDAVGRGLTRDDDDKDDESCFSPLEHVEGAHIFARPFLQKEAAARALEAFGKNKTLDFVLVPRCKLRELTRAEQNVSEETSSFLSLSVPTSATVLDLRGACEKEMEKCVAAVRALRKEMPPVILKRKRNRLADSKLALAKGVVAAGSYAIFAEKERKEKLAAERRAMVCEDCYSRLAQRYDWAYTWLRDYELYCRLVATFGVPFSEEDFELFGNGAGLEFQRRCRVAALAFQRLWRSRGWLRSMRRKSASTKIQTCYRGREAQRKWHPVLKLRRRVSSAKPKLFAFRQWRTVVSRTKKLRALNKRIKYANAAKILRQWRKVVGLHIAEDASQCALNLVIDFCFDAALRLVARDLTKNSDNITDNYAENAADKSLRSTVDYLFESGVVSVATYPLLPFMDDRWFLRTFDYETHLKLAKASVLDPDIFHKEQHNLRRVKATTQIQSHVRSHLGRQSLRPRVAALYRKKYHPAEAAFYYINTRTGTVQWRRPNLIDRLFPKASF